MFNNKLELIFLRLHMTNNIICVTHLQTLDYCKLTSRINIFTEKKIVNFSVQSKLRKFMTHHINLVETYNNVHNKRRLLLKRAITIKGENVNKIYSFSKERNFSIHKNF